MGWSNNFSSWSELEKRLSDKKSDQHPDAKAYGPGADGNDAPAWSRSRAANAQAGSLNTKLSSNSQTNNLQIRSKVSYGELHCHSSFSFLDGVSDPEDLVHEAVRLDLKGLALTDHNGFYGVVRFAEAAKVVGLPTVFGVELTLDKLDVSDNQTDPDGVHLLVIAKDPKGYAGLARVTSHAQLAGRKGSPRLSLHELNGLVSADVFSHWTVLTGCRKGLVPQALEKSGPTAALNSLNHLADQFGRENVLVELWDHGHPLDSARNDALVDVAFKGDFGIVATNNVHYAKPNKARLANSLASVRSRRSLENMQGWLPPSGMAHLRSGDEQAVRFARYPGVVEFAAEVAQACAFDLSLVAPQLPPYICPDGLSEMAYLRQLSEQGAKRLYGPRHQNRKAWQQIDKELSLIEQLGFAGYFLVVWDIVEFCNKNNILCQGRGSAANSAVCYCLGITKADAVGLDLLFERFLSPEREGPPDIDLDIESGRREEVIQYVYERYGRHHAALVANVVTYRAKSSVRDAAKALGYSSVDQNDFSKSVDRWSSIEAQSSEKASGDTKKNGQESTGALPVEVADLALQIEGLPRHLGIHSGGMVICDRPIIEKATRIRHLIPVGVKFHKCFLNDFFSSNLGTQKVSRHPNKICDFCLIDRLKCGDLCIQYLTNLECKPRI